MICPVCRAEVPDGSVFCPACGAEMPAAAPILPAASELTCPDCGRTAPAGSRFCPYCSHPLAGRAPDAPVPSVGADQPDPPESRSSPVPETMPSSPARAALQRAATVRRASPAPPRAPRKRGRNGCCVGLAAVALLGFLAVGGVLTFIATSPDALSDLLSLTVRVATPTASSVRAERPAGSTPAPGAPSVGQATLSADQERLVERLSHPDTFVLVLGSGDDGEPERLEMWNYHVLGTCFTFADGAFRGVDEAMTLDADGFPGLLPQAFGGAMTLDDVTRVVGEAPYVGAALAEEIMPGAEIYVYDRGMVVAMIDGRLAYASTEWALPATLP